MAARPAQRTRAIVIGRTKLAETDLILTLLGASGACLRAVGKGARRPTGRLAGRCELFCEADLLIAPGKNLGVITEATLVNAHGSIRGDLDRLSAASALCNICRLMCFEDAPDTFLYPITSRALTACEQASDRAHLDLVCAAYAFKMLAHGGWWPEIARCVECGDAAPTRFSATAGGALCESCATSIEGAELVSSRELEWIGVLIHATFDEVLVAPIDANTACRLAIFAHRWSTTHLDARLRAWEFMLSL